VKPIGYFFLGIPAGALWMGLWMHAHIQRAAAQLRAATEMHLRTERIFQKIKQALTEGKVPR
jgi:hypothetical protein